MGIPVGRDYSWTEEASRKNHGIDTREADDILHSITRSLDQIHLAADFLLLREDPEACSPDQQLACLIKDRMAQIERKVTELYRMLQYRDHGFSLLNH